MLLFYMKLDKKKGKRGVPAISVLLGFYESDSVCFFAICLAGL